jgi:positive regulator of sigma E activity
MTIGLTLVTITIVIGLALLAYFSKGSVVLNTLNKENLSFNSLIIILPLIVWLVLVKYMNVTQSLFLREPRVIFGVLIVTILFYFSGKK